MTGSLLGKEALSLGPAQLFWDSDTLGANIDLGCVDATVLRWQIQKTGLVCAQAGSEPDDMAVTGTICEVEMGMAEATVERIKETIQGISTLEVGGATKRIFGASVVGQRDRAIAKQMTLIELIDGVLSTNPLEIFDFFVTAPTANAEWTFDAATQRFVAHLFKVYQSKDPLKVDINGAPLYFASRLVP